jgi:hypothetical protein
MAKNCSVCGEKIGGVFGAIESLEVQGVCSACIYKHEQDERENSDSRINQGSTPFSRTV